jgi:hypothetical protein
MIRPKEDEYHPFFHDYVTLVPEADVLSALEAQLPEVSRVRALVPEHSETFAYAPGKWTIRELVGHVGDGERVFGFRAFSFSRFDSNPLPGFDENDYVANAGFNALPLAALLEDFALQRRLNLRMLRGLSDAQWAGAGTANGHAVTVRALAFIMAGHVRHHLGMLRDRYGIKI